MHFGSSSDSWDPCSKAKPSYAQYIIRRGEAKLHILELTSVFHHLPSVGPKKLCALAHLRCTRKAGTSQCKLFALYLDDLFRGNLKFLQGQRKRVCRACKCKPSFRQRSFLQTKVWSRKSRFAHLDLINNSHTHILVVTKLQKVFFIDAYFFGNKADMAVTLQMPRKADITDKRYT